MFLEVPRVPSWRQNRSKIDPKRYQKQDVILNGFWMALGSMLGRFWKPSWDLVGSKISTKGIRKRCQKVINKNNQKK